MCVRVQDQYCRWRGRINGPQGVDGVELSYISGVTTDLYCTPIKSHMDTSWDEYDAYDLSEFSAANFVHIDSNTTGATTRTSNNNRATAPEEDKVIVVTDGDWTRAIGTGGSGGLPQVVVELESATDEPVVVKVAGGGSGSGDSIVVVDGASRRSPLEEFRSQTLSVSDLVGPAWYIPPLFFSCL